MYTVNFDGRCGPNPYGRATAAFIVKKDERIIHTESFEIIEKDSSNNVAEYGACIMALLYLFNTGRVNEEIEVMGDSNLVILQMFQHKPRIATRFKGLYADYARQCGRLVSLFPNMSGRWIPREENSLADSLAARGGKKVDLRRDFPESSPDE